MLAVMLAEFGPPSVLTPAELPDPVPGPGQVVVEAAFANITFVETQIRAGRPPNPAMAPALPAVLGNGIGGVVSAVGEGADPALARHPGRHEHRRQRRLRAAVRRPGRRADPDPRSPADR